MSRFTDTIDIRIRAGKGGAGAVSFHREKYIPKGGPDGGDGGRGGDVFVVADRRYSNLSHLFPDRLYAAEGGSPGSGGNRTGADGKSLTVGLPPGTRVIDKESGELLADLVEEEKPVLVASGGTGGHGNAFFKSSTHQTPRFSQPGMPGEEKLLQLDLVLIADVGLIGLPNAGKSSLLAALTRARPKIGDYPFTTLTPGLGVLQLPSGRTCRIADIPGIIEGAHRGHGLGLSFLRHIERVGFLIFVIDVTDEDISYSISLLRNELGTYSRELLNRPSVTVLNKCDLLDEELVDMLTGGQEDFLRISAIEGTGTDALISMIDEYLETNHAP
jgi:GTP-binding protein